METTRWASKFYKFTLCRDFFTGIPQVIQSNHSALKRPICKTVGGAVSIHVTNRSESSEMFATVVLSYLHGRNNWPSTHSCYYMMSLTKIKLLYILRLSLDSRNQSNYLIHSYVQCITSGSGMSRTRCQQWLLDQEEGKVEAASSLPVLRTAAC